MEINLARVNFFYVKSKRICLQSSQFPTLLFWVHSVCFPFAVQLSSSGIYSKIFVKMELVLFSYQEFSQKCRKWAQKSAKGKNLMLKILDKLETLCELLLHILQSFRQSFWLLELKIFNIFFESIKKPQIFVWDISDNKLINFLNLVFIML